MLTFHEVADVFHLRSAIFRLPTSSHGDVYMRVDRTNYCNDESAVVEVDAAKFLALWRSHGSHSDVAHGTPETWPLDYKYAGAVDGFSHGRENPVPLADVECWEQEIVVPVFLKRSIFHPKRQIGTERKTIPSLGFTNGVTRTIWLLSHGVTVFPVRLSVKSAEVTQQLVGATGSRWTTVDQLVPAREHPW